MHLGNARTALYNWLFARHLGEQGTFILRIEDTDKARSTDEAIDHALRAMRWMGMTWDEGPEVGGDFGPYFQSQRTGKYAAALEAMRANGSAYECFCSADELDTERAAAIDSGKPTLYSRKCHALGAEERAQRVAAGVPYVVRFYVPDGKTAFTDVILGTTSFENEVISDFIIQRSDRSFVYNFCNVVDDAAMKITHVVRGNDHLSNTPKQVMMYGALGYNAPTFAHLPMILGPDKAKLGKRHGAAAVEELDRDGYFAPALVNYLALLGWSKDDETTVMTVGEMQEAFDLGRVSKSPAVFDYQKLRWINGQHLRLISPEEFAAAYDQWRSRWLEPSVPGHDAAHAVPLEMIPALVQEKVETFSDVPDYLAFMVEPFAITDAAWQKLLKVTDPEVILARTAQGLSELSNFSLENIEVFLRGLCDELELKPGKVFAPIRFAVTGRTVAPGLWESIFVLGQEKAVSRLNSAVDRLRSAVTAG